jgi:hypothetical protein
MINMNVVQAFFVHHRIISAAKKIEFVSDRITYTILRIRWCHIIVINVHVPAEGKFNDDEFDRICEKLECVFIA